MARDQIQRDPGFPTGKRKQATLKRDLYRYAVVVALVVLILEGVIQTARNPEEELLRQQLVLGGMMLLCLGFMAYGLHHTARRMHDQEVVAGPTEVRS